MMLFSEKPAFLCLWPRCRLQSNLQFLESRSRQFGKDLRNGPLVGSLPDRDMAWPAWTYLAAVAAPRVPVGTDAEPSRFLGYEA